MLPAPCSPFRKPLGVLALSAALASAQPAFAQDDPLERLMELYDSGGWFENLAEEVSMLADPEFGFPPEYIEAWSSAAAEAFEYETMRTELVEALRAELPEQSIEDALALEGTEAAIAFSLAAEDMQSRAANDPEAFLSDMAQLSSQTSSEDLAIYEALFAAQYGPQQAGAVVDGVYRMMDILATPIYGAEIAEEWIELAKAEQTAEAYEAEFFLAATGAYSQLSPEQRDTLLADTLADGIVEYHEHYMLAFTGAYNAAIDRLAKGFEAELAAQ